jgi:hypothetical protein
MAACSGLTCPAESGVHSPVPASVPRDCPGSRQVPACGQCALRGICDGFHAQYAARWGGDEAVPYAGPLITDPRHFIQHQDKNQYPATASDPGGPAQPAAAGEALAAPLGLGAGGGAGARHNLPAE